MTQPDLNRLRDEACAKFYKCQLNSKGQAYADSYDDISNHIKLSPSFKDGFDEAVKVMGAEEVEEKDRLLRSAHGERIEAIRERDKWRKNLEAIRETGSNAIVERDKLRSLNKELVSALEAIAKGCPTENAKCTCLMNHAQIALAKAKERG